jgi:uncharacterized protein (DUF488 family)
MTRLYTIGYGGRTPASFVDLLREHAVPLVIDVRLRPDKAHLGAFALARSPDKGIERLLADAGIAYRSLVELGNPFVGLDDWPDRHRRLFASAGDVLVERLSSIEPPYALLCAEKRPEACHRSVIADHLARTRGIEVVHLV